MKSSFLWFIDRETFRNAISSMITKNYKENIAFIEKNSFFSISPFIKNIWHLSRKINLPRLLSIKSSKKIKKSAKRENSQPPCIYSNQENLQNINKTSSKGRLSKANLYKSILLSPKIVWGDIPLELTKMLKWWLWELKKFKMY